MAFVHGKNSVTKVDSSGGSLVDLSSYLTSVSFPMSVDSSETTTFGASAKTYIPGLSDATVSMEGNFDTTADAHFAGIKGQSATVTIEYNPAGTTSGLPKYTAEAILTSYEVSSGVGDVITFSAEFQITGAITRSSN